MFADQATTNAVAETEFLLFRHSVPLRTMLHETMRAVGDTHDLTCLDIGAPNGVLSYYLRKRGGTWHSGVLDDTPECFMQAVVDTNVHRLNEPVLPFDNKVFDVVVIFEGLTGVEAHDDALIEEVHRVLKPDGRIVVNVVHDKPYSFVRWFQRVLNSLRHTTGLLRSGYTESELFSGLKHGFNVVHVRSYSKGCVEFIDTLVRFARGRLDRAEPGAIRRLRRQMLIASAFYWLASQLDLLLVLTRGHVLVATAQRRAWRPRNAPVLVDGRSISEAVLSKPGV